MTNSILVDIKKYCHIASDDDSFDDELILYLNGLFRRLYTLGIGTGNFDISDDTTTWADLLTSEEEKKLHDVKNYIGLRARKIFDPPTSGIQMQALEEEIKEAGWILNVEADYL